MNSSNYKKGYSYLISALVKSILILLLIPISQTDIYAQCGSGNSAVTTCRNQQTADPTDDDYFPVELVIPNDPANNGYNYTTSGGQSGSVGASGGVMGEALEFNETWPVTVTVTGQDDGCTDNIVVQGPPSCSPWNCGGIGISVISQGCVGSNLCFDVSITGSDGLAIEILRKLSGADDPNNPAKVILTTGVGDGTYNACVSNADVQADYGGDPFFTVWVHALDATGAIIYDCVSDDLVTVETCAPACNLTVDAVTAGPCYYDAASMQSLSDVTVSVSYTDAPAGETIDVNLNGATGSITPSGTNGSGMTVITVPADGSTLTASANFNVTTSCAGSNTGTAPSNTCAPNCSLTVDAVTPGPCVWDGTASTTTVTVAVSWMDAPPGEDIIVDINGVQATIPTMGQMNGSNSVPITVPADGSTGNTVVAYFIPTSSCSSTGTFDAPAPCAPSCMLDITSVSPGSCYWDGTQSLVDVTVAFSWSAAPSGEDILIDINGTVVSVTPSGTSGSDMAVLTLPADGTSPSVFGSFSVTSSCADTDNSLSLPTPCAPMCSMVITSVSEGGCYWDGSQSLVDVTVAFTWSDAPAGEDILIEVDGVVTTVTPSGTSGSDMATVTVLASGASSTAFVEFITTSSCGDSEPINLPSPCAPSCNLSITAVTDGGCYWDGSASVVDVDVSVTWSNAPAGEDIDVIINGNFCTINVGGASSGSDLCSFTLPADGLSQSVFANFTTTTSCSAADSWVAPQPCQPACNLVITNVSDSGCFWNGTNSVTDVTVAVSWTNAPVGEDIEVQYGGNIDFIGVSSPNGSGSISLTVFADGSTDFVDAFFSTTTSCGDFDTYAVPGPCEPPCSITVDNVVAGACVFDGTNSLVDVDVTFSWMNAPAGEDIDVFVDGTTVSYTPSGTSGTHTQTVTVGATGATGAVVSVNFETTSSCFDVSNVDLPPSCSPNCELFVTVNPGACYWDGSASLVDVDVNVSWANAPGAESIDVNFAGNTMVVTPTGTPGNQTISFTVPADASSGNATANFQTTTTCSASGPYNLPGPCAPNCSITLGVMEGNCYLDGGGNSVADVTVTVSWTDAPAGEDIDVTLGGVTQTVAVSGTSGSGMTVFTVAADGSMGNISAAFNPTSSCSANAPYTLPTACNTPECVISNATATVECLENGTPLDPTDDLFKYTITVTGANVGSSYSISNGDTQMGLAYGMPMGPFNTSGFPISGGPITLDIQDIDDANCTYVLLVDPPMPCSNDVCSINTPVPDVICLDNGTPADPTDDLFKYSLEVTGSNVGTTYSITGGDNQPGLAYNTLVGPFNMAGFPISGGDFTITITDDAAGATCFTTVDIIAPAPCSNESCFITPTIDVICDDNGTPGNPADDLFRYTVDATGNNIGTTYTISGDDSQMGLAYGTLVGPFTMAGFPVSGGDLNLTLTDDSDATCLIDVVVEAPSCLTEVCELDMPLVTVNCLDNGTLTDPSDDLFQYTITVTGTNTGTTYNISGSDTHMGLGYGLSMGPFTMAGFPISGGSLTLNINDSNDINCATTIVVDPPDPCSDEDCSLEDPIIDVTCLDNGTPTDPSDDQFEYAITVNGTNVGPSYTIMGDDMRLGLGYGAPAGAFGSFPISGGDLNLTIKDDSDPSCTVPATVEAPDPCSDACSIMADISNIECNDNGTPFISSDDYITFDLEVTGSNTSSSYTVFSPSSGITPATAPYNTTTTFQMDPGTAGINMLLTLRVEDSNDTDCRMYVDLQPPGVCSEDCTDPNCFGIKVTKE